MTLTNGQVIGTTPRVATSYQAVAELLSREIALGNFVAGDKLPAERMLAEQLGVARETLRQALRVLEGSGQIEVKRGARGGAFVLSNSSTEKAAVEDLRARKRELLDTLEFRRIIETQAAALAAQRRTEEHLAQMDLMQEHLLQSHSVDEARRADTVFHATIAQASRNPYLERSVEDARVLMFGMTDATFFEFQTISSYDSHAQILQAIRDQDHKLASESMHHHIEVTVQELEDLLNSYNV